MIFAPFAVFVALAGVLAFRYGTQVANMTETDVINHFAAQYLAEAGQGARLTDCFAQPGRDRIWIVVRCQGAAGAFAYHVTRFGDLARTETPG